MEEARGRAISNGAPHAYHKYVEVPITFIIVQYVLYAIRYNIVLAGGISMRFRGARPALRKREPQVPLLLLSWYVYQLAQLARLSPVFARVTVDFRRF